MMTMEPAIPDFSTALAMSVNKIKANGIVRSLSAKYRLDRYRRDKSVKFDTELP